MRRQHLPILVVDAQLVVVITHGESERILGGKCEVMNGSEVHAESVWPVCEKPHFQGAIQRTLQGIEMSDTVRLVLYRLMVKISVGHPVIEERKGEKRGEVGDGERARSYGVFGLPSSLLSGHLSISHVEAPRRESSTHA